VRKASGIVGGLEKITSPTVSLDLAGAIEALYIAIAAGSE